MIKVGQYRWRSEITKQNFPPCQAIKACPAWGHFTKQNAHPEGHSMKNNAFEQTPL
jgi:hypothetical protein